MTGRGRKIGLTECRINVGKWRGIDMAMFLNLDELESLTGRKLKSKQIEALRRMGVPFRVNAVGRPVVASAVIEGGRPPPAAKEPQWEMPK